MSHPCGRMDESLRSELGFVMAPESTVNVLDAEHQFEQVEATSVELSLEVLERNLTSHAAHLAAAEAQWLAWLGEYCIREGWGEWGCSGPVQWLSWRCGMSPSTARDKVRVALALRELPMIQRRHSEGRLSYSKVRAVTRVATPESDVELAQLALAATGSQLDVIVRSYKKALDADTAALSAWAARSLRSRSDDESMVYTLRVPNHDGDMVAVAVRAEVNATIDDVMSARTDISRDEIVESRGGWAAMNADAAIALLNGTAHTSGVVQPTDIEVIVDCDHNADADDPATASAEASAAENPQAHPVVVDGRSVAPTVGNRLCCDPRIAVLVEDSRGTVLGSGRQTRLVSRKLRRALERRDRRQCQFPGCAAHRRLHAHHIIHWSRDGPTELWNLILVCSFHHHVVHEGGWNVDPKTHAFVKPDGSIADPCPTQRFRGSAQHVQATRRFSCPSPLAEAENEPFDLGLVLEGLAYNHADNLAILEATTTRWKSRLEYGPPIPADLRRQRTVEAHRARVASSDRRRHRSHSSSDRARFTRRA